MFMKKINKQKHNNHELKFGILFFKLLKSLFSGIKLSHPYTLPFQFKTI